MTEVAWRSVLTVRAYGLTIRIRTNDESLLEKVKPRLPYGSRITKSGRTDFLYSILMESGRRKSALWRDSEVVLRSRSIDGLLTALGSSLSETVAEFSRTHIFVHAGAVAWRGRAVLIPGESFSGKSSLVAAFVRAGAGYLSDEYSIIDAFGRVHPFPRQLQLRDSRLDRVLTPVEALGGRPEARPLPVGAVLATKFRKGARFRPRPISPGETLLALLANTVPARTRPRAALNRFKRLAAHAAGFEGVRGEAEDVVGWFLKAELWD